MSKNKHIQMVMERIKDREMVIQDEYNFNILNQ